MEGAVSDYVVFSGGFSKPQNRQQSGTWKSRRPASYIREKNCWLGYNAKQKHLYSSCSEVMGAGAGILFYSCFQLDRPRVFLLVKTFPCQKRDTQELWKLLFSNPLQWWDHRFDKTDFKYPDFKHKTTEESLWIDKWSTPSWVRSELATLAPGTIPRNAYSWSVRITRYVKDGQSVKALELFKDMQRQGVKPDKFTFVSVLKACASLLALEEGRYIHAQILSSGCDLDIYVWNGLVDMYGKCGSIYDACIVFNSMPEHDVVSWNSMIAVYEKCGYGEKALECFQQMGREQIEPDAITFLGIINACSSLMAIEEGKRIHWNVIERGLESDIFIASSLIDMYAKCGAVEDGWRVFSNVKQRDVVLWNSMIMGYLKCAKWNKAWDLFQQMQQEGVKPNSATFVGILNGCAQVAALAEGRRIHAQTIQGRWASDAYVGTCLVDMYIKCGCIQDARRVFSNMPVRSVVSWNVMIHGYLQCGQGERVLELFQQMQRERVELDSITFLGIINACASVAALEEGWSIHSSIIRAGLEMDVIMENCLVHMYAKCGSIEDSCRVFRNMPKWDGISWNIMLEGYAMHGLGNESLLLFGEMCWKNITKDDCTFLSLLSALSHSGLVDEGGYYFESMSPLYGVQATVKHYCCMVDLYGRLGLLDEAEGIIKTMRYQPDVCVWMVLLNACRIHNNVQVGERAAMHVLELDPESEAGYVLLSNIYAAAGNWDFSMNTHQTRTKREVHKQQAFTWMS